MHHYELYHLLEAIIYVEQYTHLSHYLSRMRFKTNISFLTGPKDGIIAGDNIMQCEVIALDEGEVGSTWNIQNYIFWMLIFYTIGMQEDIEGMHQCIYTLPSARYVLYIYSIEWQLICQIADRGPRAFRYRPRCEALRSISKRPRASVGYLAYQPPFYMIYIIHNKF